MIVQKHGRIQGWFVVVSTTLLLAIALPVMTEASEPSVAIVHPNAFLDPEFLAAKEIRRYLYLRTGQLLPLIAGDENLAITNDLIVVGQKDRPLVRGLLKESELESTAAALQEQQYLLKTINHDEQRVWLITGGDAIGTLYGAYRFIEHLGVRFYLDGDVIPDDRMPLVLPPLDEQGKPLFNVRGIHSVHDFAEGPDWWDTDDYKAVFEQLAKLQMNFIGLHTYTAPGLGAEPTVWTGLSEDIGKDGRVKYSYPSTYMNTVRGTWAYDAKRTSEFHFGAAQLFECDEYGSEVTRGMTPWPKTMEENNEVFRRAGEMFNDVFSFAHSRGVRTCVGSETPLAELGSLKERLIKLGKDPNDPAVRQELYEGMFRRIMKTYPLDYFWFWTPETWIWPDVKDEEVEQKEKALQLLIAAAKQVKAPFTLATAGWVVGPPGDPTRFDRMLPKEMPMSCISKIVGRAPVNPAFAEVQGRPKWAIPWPEDDGSLISPQLWVGRMRKDAADALRYGCTGLMGNLWRTRILSPNVAALAQAAWDQSGWNKPWQKSPRSEKGIEIIGGRWSAYTDKAIGGTENDPLYQFFEYEIEGYRIEMPNGEYAVTLQFFDPGHYVLTSRTFDIKLQGKTVLDRLDIIAEVGVNHALDKVFENVEVSDGHLDTEGIS